MGQGSGLWLTDAVAYLHRYNCVASSSRDCLECHSLEKPTRQFAEWGIPKSKQLYQSYLYERKLLLRVQHSSKYHDMYYTFDTSNNGSLAIAGKSYPHQQLQYARAHEELPSGSATAARRRREFPYARGEKDRTDEGRSFN